MSFAPIPCLAATPESGQLEKPLKDEPWKQSAIQYRLASSINGMNKAADPTWNPLVVHSLALSPHWLVKEGILLGANFEMAQELTQSDWNNDGWYWSDLTIDVGFENLVVLESIKIGFDVDLALRLPTSKRSQAETLMVEPSLTIAMKREFKALKGIGVLLESGISKPFHNYSTGALESSPIAACSTAICQSLSQLPTRNVALSTRQMAAIQIGVGYNIQLAIFVGASQSKLYPLQDDARISYAVNHPPSWRVELSSGVTVAHPLTDGLSIRYGVSSSHPLLKPDAATRYTPLFNRHAIGFVELNVVPAKIF
jgi:hypothetical protein